MTEVRIEEAERLFSEKTDELKRSMTLKAKESVVKKDLGVAISKME